MISGQHNGEKIVKKYSEKQHHILALKSFEGKLNELEMKELRKKYNGRYKYAGSNPFGIKSEKWMKKNSKGLNQKFKINTSKEKNTL